MNKQIFARLSIILPDLASKDTWFNQTGYLRIGQGPNHLHGLNTDRVFFPFCDSIAIKIDCVDNGSIYFFQGCPNLFIKC